MTPIPWRFPYIHRRVEDGVYAQGLNLQWTHGPRIAWFWQTRYHSHRWSVWMPRLPSTGRVHVFSEYDDLESHVRLEGFRHPHTITPRPLWRFPYVHLVSRDETVSYNQGLNLRWHRGPSVCWIWKTAYHEHRWLVWLTRHDYPVRWKLYVEYDDLDNWVRMIGSRSYQKTTLFKEAR